MSGSTRQGDDRLGFYDQLLHDERRHQFYSRALGWVMFVSMVAIVVLGVVAAGQRAPADPECRAASAALPAAAAAETLTPAQEKLITTLGISREAFLAAKPAPESV